MRSRKDNTVHDMHSYLKVSVLRYSEVSYAPLIVASSSSHSHSLSISSTRTVDNSTDNKMKDTMLYDVSANDQHQEDFEEHDDDNEYDVPPMILPSTKTTMRTYQQEADVTQVTQDLSSIITSGENSPDSSRSSSPSPSFLSSSIEDDTCQEVMKVVCRGNLPACYYERKPLELSFSDDDEGDDGMGDHVFQTFKRERIEQFSSRDMKEDTRKKAEMLVQDLAAFSL